MSYAKKERQLIKGQENTIDIADDQTLWNSLRRYSDGHLIKAKQELHHWLVVLVGRSECGNFSSHNVCLSPICEGWSPFRMGLQHHPGGRQES